jgi:hypothetical protein
MPSEVWSRMDCRYMTCPRASTSRHLCRYRLFNIIHICIGCWQPRATQIWITMDRDGPEREKERERPPFSSYEEQSAGAQESSRALSIAISIDPNSIRSSKSIDPSTSNVVPGVRFSSVGIEGGWRLESCHPSSTPPPCTPCSDFARWMATRLP